MQALKGRLAGHDEEPPTQGKRRGRRGGVKEREKRARREAEAPGLAAPAHKPERPTTVETKPTPPAGAARRPDRPFDRDRPRAPIGAHAHEFKLLDGRPITIDRRAISFACAHKEHPDTATVIGMHVFAAKPVPLQIPYPEMLKWWLGTDEPRSARGGKATGHGAPSLNPDGSPCPLEKPDRRVTVTPATGHSDPLES
jgi:hypothetical protein